MTSRRIAEVSLSIPSNATVLDFQRTDGDSGAWPTNTSRVVDNDGQVNFMRHLDLESGTAIKWRLHVARAIATDKGLPESQAYVLRDWPAGYRMFDHNKGPVHNPRHDIYLFGSRRGRFRSINEFIPHAIWLMRDESMEHSSCQCKYCSKKTQKEVTASMPSILRSSPQSASPSPNRPRPVREKKPRQSVPSKPRERVRDTRTYAAVQRRPEVTKQAMLVERNSDLRAISSRTDLKLRRWFREGELVWCALNRPISHQNLSEDTAIKFWPALVDETRLKSLVMGRGGAADFHEYLKAEISNNQNAGAEGEVETTPQEPPWTVQQHYTYKIHLLVTNNTLLVPGDQILPYQAFAPPGALINTMGAYPRERLDFDRESLRLFNPCADGAADFESAIAPFAMALQIGGALSAYWCLTDEWATTLKTPAPPAPAKPPAPEPSVVKVTSLQDAIAKAHQHNAQTERPEISSSRLRIPEPGTQVTQFRYQGLWWGGERIWVDDFVRLKVPRRCFAPMGADNVLPPSGPGKTSREIWLQQGRELSELGAGARGIFMRLDALIVVDVEQPDRKLKKECRACGMLYELADVEWEESNQEDVQRKNTTPHGINPQSLHLNSASQPVPVTSEFALPIAATTESSSVTPSATPDSDLKRTAPSNHRYLLPEAPIGYRFRPILPEGHEAVIALSLISGRYYPRILSHPLLDETLRKAVARTPEQGGLSDSNNLWALEGLSAGYYNSVDPTFYQPTRSMMVEEADKVARSQLEQYKTQGVPAEEDEQGHSMDVDGCMY